MLQLTGNRPLLFLHCTALRNLQKGTEGFARKQWFPNVLSITAWEMHIPSPLSKLSSGVCFVWKFSNEENLNHYPTINQVRFLHFRWLIAKKESQSSQNCNHFCYTLTDKADLSLLAKEYFLSLLYRKYDQPPQTFHLISSRHTQKKGKVFPSTGMISCKEIIGPTEGCQCKGEIRHLPFPLCGLCAGSPSLQDCPDTSMSVSGSAHPETFLNLVGCCSAWKSCESRQMGNVWEIQQQGILIRASAALMQEDILNTWNLVDNGPCWNYFIVLKLASVPYKTPTVDRFCLSHKNACRLSWDNSPYFQMLIHISNSSNLGFLSVLTSAAVPFKIVKLGRNRKRKKKGRNMATASGFYLLRLGLFLHFWSTFSSSKQVKFTE